MKDAMSLSKFLRLLNIAVVGLLWGVMGCAKTNTQVIPKEPEKTFVRLLQNESISSRLLNNSINYKVLLPVNYAGSKVSYPVVYLLHGFGDNESAWIGDGLIQYYADKDSAVNGQMIFVMPQGFNSYYVNRYNGSYPYMNFFAYELVPEIDRLYRTKKNPQDRAVMGYSMGGYGAFILPMMHPEIFNIGVPLSISFRTDGQYIVESQNSFNSQWGSIFGGFGMTGQARITDYYKQLSPFHFLDQSNLAKYSGLKILLDCGDDEESLHIPNGTLHNLMRDLKFSHEFRVRNGGHSWQYWHGALSEALKFISYGFSGKSYPENPEDVSIGNQITSSQYTLENLNNSTIQLGIFKPGDYSLNSNPYPVIFWMHDFTGASRAANATKVLSLLNNSMVAGTIPNSIIVEIPIGSSEITNDILNNIISQVNTNYRLVKDKKGKVFMGNEQGGVSVCNLIPGVQNIFNGFFLFNAKIPTNSKAMPGNYYYLDVTDKSDFYQGNFDLFVDIRKNGNPYEYRVRQGTSSLQSTINGLNQSLFYLSQKLKNL